MSKVSSQLNELGYRTFAPDQRGYSDGARPRGRAAYRVSKLVGDTVALILSSRQLFLSYYIALFQFPAIPESFFRRRPEAMSWQAAMRRVHMSCV